MFRVTLFHCILFLLIAGPLVAQQTGAGASGGTKPASSCGTINLGSTTGPLPTSTSDQNALSTTGSFEYQSPVYVPVPVPTGNSAMTTTQGAAPTGQSGAAPESGGGDYCSMTEANELICMIDGVPYRGCTPLPNGDFDCTQAVPAQ